MSIISIDDIHKNRFLINQHITVFGWIRNRRDSKCGISFLDLYDGSSIKTVQVIVNQSIFNYNTEVLRLTIGCSVCIDGRLVLSIGKKQKYEIQASKLMVIGWVDFPEKYPVAAKNHTYEYLREIPHLRSRTNFIGVITRIRNTMFHAMHHFLYKKKYYWIPTPIITSLDSEGAGAMFKVSTLDISNPPRQKDGLVDFKQDFFGKESFLTVSGQLTLESYACSMGKVYSFGPTFRAENSNTTRHLSEFWMLEVEQAFFDLNEISELSEQIIKYIINFVLKHCSNEMNFLQNKIDANIFQRLEKFLSSEIVHINYSDAIQILQDSDYNFKNPISMGMDLFSEHEKYLVDHYFFNAVFVKNFPKHLKAFYMKLNNDGHTVSSMDLLIPGIGEILGGSQREENKSILKNRLLELNLNKKDYSWYIDLRRYGSVPHSGFGLGFERLISYITGIYNVKDLIPFPRTINHALC
ncbi:asparagine--tRNA ligase [Buchnera aphidicola]|uniref:asparagine--tRNA ligase n=1 Tax=Buchnera aphidicola TaxID=9 RepID=UPI003463A251